MWSVAALLVIGVVIVGGDRSQLDCQENEVFIQCGRCEGTCKTPVVEKCDENCRLPRCECQLVNGFVRAHDGACIKASECATYLGIYIFGDGNYHVLGREPASPTDVFGLAPTVESEVIPNEPERPSAAPPAYGPDSIADFDTVGAQEYDQNVVGEFEDAGTDYKTVMRDDPYGAKIPAFVPSNPSRPEPYLHAYIYGPPRFSAARY